MHPVKIMLGLGGTRRAHFEPENSLRAFVRMVRDLLLPCRFPTSLAIFPASLIL